MKCIFKQVRDQWNPMVLLALLFLAFAGCKKEKDETLFVLRKASETGVEFQNTINTTTELNILNYIYFYNGAGVAAGDFNGDERIDLYFTANQEADRLFLNLGNFKFEEITEEAGISNSGNWTNGVTAADVNGDGWLDIYVCRIGKHETVEGHNLLYINKGPNELGVPQFAEEAANYGLAFSGYSTQAAFFDYDLDGDLDLFLLNHATNPNQNYGNGSLRNRPNEESGDKLFENQGGTFVDVSEASGIFQSKFGYGLGVSISDLNQDGYPDIYVGNDFFENDYLYINQGDKTFKELISGSNNPMGHTTHFSMGNDIGDINNDGLTDVLSVDMLPEDLTTFKTSGAEFNYQIYQNYLNNGYAPQYMQNSLHLNRGDGAFSEVAQISGMAATEWSWSPLIADFDNDGMQDVYITNGILGATNDMDFINFIANEEIQKSLSEQITQEDLEFIKKIPVKKTRNYFFRNAGNAQFVDSTNTWSPTTESFSNGAAYADLDNDGDLDVVVNNVNENAFILENRSITENSKRSYLSISLNSEDANTQGIGAKVFAYSKDVKWFREVYTSRGFLSAVPARAHFGFSEVMTLDSVQVIWPDGAFQTLYNVTTNEHLQLNKEDALSVWKRDSVANHADLVPVSPLFGFTHKDNRSLEFNRDPLLPFAISNEGPGISIADINNDGVDDVFVGGGKGQASALFVQDADGSFTQIQEALFAQTSINEDVAHVIFDANGDGFNDLLVVSGGNEFKAGDAIAPRLYVNDKGIFRRDTLQFSGISINASSVSVADIDQDKDLDVLITSNSEDLKFGHTPTQYIFTNNGDGSFSEATQTIAPQLKDLGNCTAAEWVDLNGDSFPDLVLAGTWMEITILINNNGRLELQDSNGLEGTYGWWKGLKVADFDNDGDYDIVAGNWGLNTRLKASNGAPVTLYSADFDNNGKIDPIITYSYKGEETTFASKDDLVKQMPFLNKKFLSYADFADANMAQLFGEEALKSAYKKYANELGSCYFENNGKEGFTLRYLPWQAQISSVNDMHVEDFNNDGYLDLFLIGNNFEISTQLSRLDALHGLLLLNDKNGGFSSTSARDLGIYGASRNVEKLVVSGQSYLVVTRNNDQPVFLKIE